jgi:3-oxoacyl-[acyl-carrier protein] reductase
MDNNKVVIVTGASSGIGAATVKLLAKNNYNVAFSYNNKNNAADKIQKFCESIGAKTFCDKLDVSDDSQCNRFVNNVINKWEHIDGLVNCAGTRKFCDHANLDGLTKEDFLNTYSVNTVGTFQMVRAVVPIMKKNKLASIVNIASVAGILGIGSSIAYAASKGAVITMTKSLARILGPEICVNAICPGLVESSWLKNGLGEDKYNSALQHYENVSPLTVSKPEDVAEAVYFFLTKQSNTTGEIFIQDGGWSLTKGMI